MNHKVKIEEVDSDELCELCATQLSEAKAANETEIWINRDGHVSRDPNKLEDREATFNKYGV